MVVFTKEFGTLDPHLPIVWDKVPNETVFLGPSLIAISASAAYHMFLDLIEGHLHFTKS